MSQTEFVDNLACSTTLPVEKVAGAFEFIEARVREGRVPSLGHVLEEIFGFDELKQTVESMYPVPFKIGIKLFLLDTSMCYLSNKKYKVINGNRVPSFDIYVGTRNYGLIEGWSEDSATKRVQKQLEEIDALEIGPDFVKLGAQVDVCKMYYKGGEPKITCPRTPIGLKYSGDITVVFYVEALFEAIRRVAEEQPVGVEFIKDGGEKRTVVVSYNQGYVDSIYGEGFYSSIEGDITGELPLSAGGEGNFSRGYVRVPSLGEPITDDIRRSVTLTRIRSINLQPLVDTYFVHVNLSKVIPFFLSCMYENNREAEVHTALRAVNIGVPFTDIMDYDEWASMSHLLHGTQFIKDLYMFMLSQPQHFDMNRLDAAASTDMSTAQPEAIGLV